VPRPLAASTRRPLLARGVVVATVLSAGIVSAGCGARPEVTAVPSADAATMGTSEAAESPAESLAATDSGAPAAVDTAPLPPASTTAAPPPPYAGPDPASVGANELGDVPVLMYHQIVPEPKSVYDRRPEEFKAELERLAAEGYVPVTAAEYARGDLSAVPAGSHAVVLTFDDATTSQVSLGADGNPAPGTAVAILQEVAAAHPGFRPVATFYVNGDAFASDAVLPWLAANGFEIGNHTLQHTNLSDKPAEEVRGAIATLQAEVARLVPGVAITTMALPRGGKPEDMTWAVEGSSGGVSYRHGAVMLVGWRPAPSPFAAEFDPTGVPRIRSQGLDGPEPEYGSTGWLDQLAASPETRYTSDGEPNWVSFPSARAGELDPALAAKAKPY